MWLFFGWLYRCIKKCFLVIVNFLFIVFFVCLRALKNASSFIICLGLLALMNALFIFWCFVWFLVFLLFCDDG